MLESRSVPADRMSRRAFLLALLVPFSVAVIAIALLALTGRDISARTDLATDVVLRDAVDPSQLHPYRFADASPFSVWLPSDHFVWRSIRSGHLPLWNRAQAGGYSPLANLQSGVLHPLRWIVAVLPESLFPSAIVILALALLFAGGYVCFVECIGASAPAAFAGAAILALSGYPISTALFSGEIVVLAHLPWIVWAYSRWRSAREPRFFALLALLLSLTILGGHPAFVLAVITTFVAFAVCDALATRDGRRLATSLGALATGVALAATALAPAIEAWSSGWTYKSLEKFATSYDVTSFSGWLHQLSAIVFDARLPEHNLDYFTSSNYAGLWALAAAIFGAIAVRREALFIRFVLPVAFLLAFPPPFLGYVAIHTPLRYVKTTYVQAPFQFALALAAAAGIDLLYRKVSPSLAKVVALAAIAIPLVSYVQRDLSMLVPREGLSIDSPTITFLRAHAANDRVTGLRGQTHLPNFGELTGVEDLRISSPLLPIRYRSWFTYADRAAVASSFPTTLTTDRPDFERLGSFNVRWIVQSRLPSLLMYSAPIQPGTSGAGKYLPPVEIASPLVRKVFESASVRIFENLAARSRASLEDDFAVVPEGVARAGVTLEQKRIIVESDHPVAARFAHVAYDRGRIAVSYPFDSRVVIATDRAIPSLLVLNDAYAEGWSAAIDGRPADVHPVNLYSRGVFVPSGRHTITMQFVPPGLTAGATVSVCAALLLLAGSVMRQRQVRRRGIRDTL